MTRLPSTLRASNPANQKTHKLVRLVCECIAQVYHLQFEWCVATGKNEHLVTGYNACLVALRATSIKFLVTLSIHNSREKVM